jgi:hypothetical protein
VQAGPVIGAGFLPGVASGVQLGVLLDPLGLPGLELSGAYFPWHEAGDVSFSLAYGRLAVCPLDAETGLARFSSCAGMAVGALYAQGYSGILDPVVHPFLDARASRRIAGPLIATLGVGIAVPLRRRYFNYNPPFQMSPVAGTLDLGLGVEVP